MAILNMPYLARTARGKFGKVMVNFIWKTLNVVRAYVIPTNPNTPAQQVPRGYMGDWNTENHATAFTSADDVAFRLLSSIDVRILTGVNVYCSEYLDVRHSPSAWSRMWNGDDLAAPLTDRRLRVEAGAGLASVRVRWGTKPRVLINDAACAWDAGLSKWFANIAVGALTSGVRYYYQFYDGANYPARIGLTGIYYFDMP